MASTYSNEKYINLTNNNLYFNIGNIIMPGSVFTRVSGSGSGRERTESGRRLGAGIYQTGLFVMQQLSEVSDRDQPDPPGTEQTTWIGCQRSVSRINEREENPSCVVVCRVCYDGQYKNNATIKLIGEIKAFWENVSIYLKLNWFSEISFCLIFANRICYRMLLFDHHKRSRQTCLINKTKYFRLRRYDD